MTSKLLLTAAGFMPLVALNAQAAEKKPNVVFIIADDMVFDAMNTMSENEVYTPNLDRLRESGAYFSHAFNQGAYSAAVSVASRTMLNTGKYIWRAANATNKKLSLVKGNWPSGSAPYVAKPNVTKKFWSDYMKEAGYETYIAGKWHVPKPGDTNIIFDHSKDIKGGMPNQTPQGYAYSAKNPEGRKFIEGQEDAWAPYKTEYGGNWKGGTHWSKLLADNAIAYINEATKKSDPYFMYFGFNAPHDPRQSPKEYVDMYPVENIVVPKSMLPLYPYATPMGCPASLRDAKLAPHPRTDYAVKVNRQEYFASITYLDFQLGRIYDALEKAGQLENTYIMFTADHGIEIGEHGLMGKQDLYEGSLRVPFMIAGPGIKPCVVDHKVYLQDAMATAMEIAGSEHLDKVDFKSLLSLAKGAKTSEAVNEYVYAAYQGRQRMIRSDRYKMIIYPTAGKGIVRLYDLKSDPDEIKDIAGKKTRKISDALLAEMQKLQVEMEDQLDVTPYYEAFFKGAK